MTPEQKLLEVLQEIAAFPWDPANRELTFSQAVHGMAAKAQQALRDHQKGSAS
jgi:hypothetical protein